MKEVAILLLLALVLNGCGSSTPTLQSTSGGVWLATLYGGVGDASGLSFITQFTVNSDGTLNITSFQFLNLNQSPGTCFTSVSAVTPTGSVLLQLNTNDTVTGSIKYVVQANGNTLTLNGTVSGTAIVTANNSSASLTGATISGDWLITGTGCNDAGGSFTMTEP
jgi:hypothetical protein